MFSLRRCGAGKQREEVLDETDTTWQQSVHYFRGAIQDKSIDLKFVFDIDEMCLFFCGHIGWAKNPKSIQKQRVENDHKQDKNYRMFVGGHRNGQGSQTSCGWQGGRGLRHR